MYSMAAVDCLFPTLPALQVAVGVDDASVRMRCHKLPGRVAVVWWSQVLGVDQMATLEQLRSARNAKALTTHPDKTLNMPGSNAASQRVQEVRAERHITGSSAAAGLVAESKQAWDDAAEGCLVVLGCMQWCLLCLRTVLAFMPAVSLWMRGPRVWRCVLVACYRRHVCQFPEHRHQTLPLLTCSVVPAAGGPGAEACL